MLTFDLNYFPLIGQNNAFFTNYKPLWAARFRECSLISTLTQVSLHKEKSHVRVLVSMRTDTCGSNKPLSQRTFECTSRPTHLHLAWGCAHVRHEIVFVGWEKEFALLEMEEAVPIGTK